MLFNNIKCVISYYITNNNNIIDSVAIGRRQYLHKTWITIIINFYFFYTFFKFFSTFLFAFKMREKILILICNVLAMGYIALVIKMSSILHKLNEFNFFFVIYLSNRMYDAFGCSFIWINR